MVAGTKRAMGLTMNPEPVSGHRRQQKHADGHAGGAARRRHGNLSLIPAPAHNRLQVNVLGDYTAI